MNSRTLGEMFDFGKTQILKQKDSLLSMYESNASGCRIHTNKTSHVSEYEENLFMSGTLACSKNVPMGHI